MKLSRKIVYCLSDPHSGWKYGLLRSGCQLPPDMSGQPPRIELNSTQLLLQAIVDNSWKLTKELAGKDEIIIYIGGDIIQGYKHLAEVPYTRPDDQKIIAYYNLLPFVSYKNVKIVRMSESTPAHSGGEGSSDQLVALMLKEKYFKKDIQARSHGRLDIDGFIIDYTHKGPSPGGYEWTKGNAARSYLRDRMMKDLKVGKKPASIYLRSHFHEYIKVHHEIRHEFVDYESWLAMLPSCCGLGDYGREAMKALPYIEIGAIALEVINGRMLESHKFTEILEIRHEEIL